MIGRDTSEFQIDRKVRNDLITNVDRPEVLRDMFARADGLAFGRGNPAEYLNWCATQPCVLWNPEDPKQRHVTVRIARSTFRELRHVCRVVWRITRNVVSAQGPALRGDEVVHHSCSAKGDNSDGSARGSCLNPAHLQRGNEETLELKIKVGRTAKRLERKLGGAA